MIEDKLVLAILGMPAAGKGTTANFIKEKLKDKNVKIIRYSDSLAEALRIFLPEIGRKDFQWFANSIRDRFGDNILARAVEKKVKKGDFDVAILDGARVRGDEEIARQNGWKLVYVDAPVEVRWERAQKRLEKSDDSVTLEKFKELDKGRTEVEIQEIGSRANFRLDNNGTLKQLENQVDDFLKQLKLI